MVGSSGSGGRALCTGLGVSIGRLLVYRLAYFLGYDWVTEHCGKIRWTTAALQGEEPIGRKTGEPGGPPGRHPLLSPQSDLNLSSQKPYLLPCLKLMVAPSFQPFE